MNIFDLMQGFNDYTDENQLPTGQIVLWYALVNINNSLHWKQKFTVANHTLQIKTGLSKAGIIKARNALKQRGLIDFDIKSNQASSYSITPFNKSENSEENIDNNYQPSRQQVDGKETASRQQVDGKETASRPLINNNYNNNYNKNKKEKYKKEKEKSAGSFLDGFDLSADVKNLVLDFVDSRKKLRSPMTNRAIEMFIKKLNGLAKTDPEKIELLEAAIERGWKSVFPLNKQKEPKNSLGRPTQQVGEKYTVDDSTIPF